MSSTSAIGAAVKVLLLNPKPKHRRISPWAFLDTPASVSNILTFLFVYLFYLVEAFIRSDVQLTKQRSRGVMGLTQRPNGDSSLPTTKFELATR